MNEPVTIDNEFKSLIPPLSQDEYRQLEENCRRDGILDSLKVWHGILIDGHNRYQISEDWNLNYQTEELDFPDRDAVLDWIIDNQLGRRNLPAISRIALVEQKPSVIKAKKDEAKQRQGTRTDKLNIVQKSARSRDEIAKLANTSHDTYSKGVAILNSGDSDLIDAVKSGEISINQGYRTVMAERTPSIQTSRQKEASQILEARQRHSDFEEKKSEGVVSIQDARQDKADKKRIAEDLYKDLRSLTNKGYWIGALNSSAEFSLLTDIIPDSERPEMRDRVQKMILVLNRLLEALRNG